MLAALNGGFVASNFAAASSAFGCQNHFNPEWPHEALAMAEGPSGEDENDELDDDDDPRR